MIPIRATANSGHLTLAAFLLLAGLSLSAQNQPAANPAPTPAASVDLSAIGYHKLSKGDRLNHEWGESLDFVDANHVLVTFDPKKLFKRLPDCPPEHDDRLLHAAILEVPSGKVLQEADWYLHDHRRYLWPLGSGLFLLRKLNSLYVVDSNLHEEQLLNSPKDLLWVSVTADRQEIIVETAETAAAAPGSQSAAVPAKPKFRIEFLDAKSLAPHRTVETKQEVDLEGTSAGYVDFIHREDLWLVRFGPNSGKRQNIARVRTESVPEVTYPNDDSILIGRHSLIGNDYSLTAFTVGGRRLWRQRWSRLRYFPTVASTESGSRSAVSTLLLKSTSASQPVASDYDSDENHGIEQSIQIFETASGTPVQSVDVSPVVMSEQNFSLSPDGRHLAVLGAAGIDLYALPEPAAEEQAKFAAFKATLADLYALAPGADADSLLSTESASKGAAPASANPAPDAAPQAATPPAPADLATVDQTLPTFRASTQAVLVDVVVTDSKGKLIRGIPQQDFTVMEDGKPQDLRSFHEFSDTKPAPPAAAPGTPVKHTPNNFSNDTRGNDPGAVTVILLDLLNTALPDQVYARDQLIRFLKNKPKDAQFALCTLSSVRGANHSSLRLIQGFTPDESVLLAAVNGKKGATRSVTWRSASDGLSTSASTVTGLAQGTPRDDWQALLVGIQQLQSEEREADTDARVGVTIEALSELARYLSGISGRKNLVWLSGSFPATLFDPQTLDNSPNMDNRNYTNRIKQATNLLAQAQVAVYPIDVRGLDVGDVNAAAMGGIAPGTQGIAAAPLQSVHGQLTPSGQISMQSPGEAFQQDEMTGLSTRESEIEAINEVASETGGKAFFNTNGITEAIATAMEQGSNYYSLSYSPNNKNYNGRFRKIKVVLAQKGYHLHYRPGYFADDPSAPARDPGLSHSIRVAAMQHGAPQSHQILFSARVVPVGYKAKADSASVGRVLLASAKKPILPAEVDVQRYAIDFTLDSSDLRFVPSQNGTYHSALVFMFAAYDEDGVLLSAVSNVGNSDVQPAAFKQLLSGGCQVHQEIDVPVKASFLRLGIQDQMSNDVGTLEFPLPVPPDPNAPRVIRRTLPEIEPD